jgi:hypothetical protein
MLSVDHAALKEGQANRLYVLELDLGSGRVMVQGEVDIAYEAGGKFAPRLTSGASGGRYRNPHMVGEVALWEEHDSQRYLAIFADEQSMRNGGRELVTASGDVMPVGIYRALCGEGE